MAKKSNISNQLQAIIDDTSYEGESNSVIGDILQSIIDETPYTDTPKSVIANLLLELKAKIEGGGEVPEELKQAMNAVLNKKMSTTVTYPPDVWADTVNLLGKLPIRTASGAVASFNDGADDVPVKSLTANIDYKDATGFNVVNVTRAGKNLAPITGSPTTTGVEFTINSNGTITANGSQSTQVIYEVSSFIAEKDMTIIYSGCTGGGYSTFSVNMRVNNSYMGDVLDGDSTAKNINKGDTVKFLIVVRANVVMNDVVFKPMIRLSSETDSTFEPYTGETVEIDLGGTIYGGSVDITNGTVTSTKAQDGTNLPEPVVTTIDSTAINTLYGVNNIWSDTGDISLEYRADIDLLINSLES